MSLIKKLKDELNNIVFPETKIKAVSDDTGKTLDVVLSEMNNNLADITEVKIGQITTDHTLKYSSGKIYKIGRLCHLFVNIQLTSDVNAFTVFANVPSDFRPVQTVCGVDEDMFSGVEIDANGKLKFTKNLSTNKTIVFSLTYICKE